MKRLITHTTSLMNYDVPLIEVSMWQYVKLRLDFKTWRLQRTMGRSVLVLRNAPLSSEKDGA